MEGEQVEEGAWGERTHSPAQGSGFSRDHAPPEIRGTLSYLLLPSAGQVQLKKEALKQPPPHFYCQFSNFLAKGR